MYKGDRDASPQDSGAAQPPACLHEEAHTSESCPNSTPNTNLTTSTAESYVARTPLSASTPPLPYSSTLTQYDDRANLHAKNMIATINAQRGSSSNHNLRAASKPNEHCTVAHAQSSNNPDHSNTMSNMDCSSSSSNNNTPVTSLGETGPNIYAKHSTSSSSSSSCVKVVCSSSNTVIASPLMRTPYACGFGGSSHRALLSAHAIPGGCSSPTLHRWHTSHKMDPAAAVAGNVGAWDSLSAHSVSGGGEKTGSSRSDERSLVARPHSSGSADDENSRDGAGTPREMGMISTPTIPMRYLTADAPAHDGAAIDASTDANNTRADELARNEKGHVASDSSPDVGSLRRNSFPGKDGAQPVRDSAMQHPGAQRVGSMYSPSLHCHCTRSNVHEPTAVHHRLCDVMASRSTSRSHAAMMMNSSSKSYSNAKARRGSSDDLFFMGGDGGGGAAQTKVDPLYSSQHDTLRQGSTPKEKKNRTRVEQQQQQQHQRSRKGKDSNDEREDGSTVKSSALKQGTASLTHVSTLHSSVSHSHDAATVSRRDNETTSELSAVLSTDTATKPHFSCTVSSSSDEDSGGEWNDIHIAPVAAAATDNHNVTTAGVTTPESQNSVLKQCILHHVKDDNSQDAAQTSQQPYSRYCLGNGEAKTSHLAESEPTQPQEDSSAPTREQKDKQQDETGKKEAVEEEERSAKTFFQACNSSHHWEQQACPEITPCDSSISHTPQQAATSCGGSLRHSLPPDSLTCSAMHRINKSAITTELLRRRARLQRQLLQLQRESAEHNIFALVRTSNASQLQTLLQCDSARVRQRDYNDCTPLHVAATEGNLTAVRVLLSFGADVYATDREGRTPLDCAAANRHGGVGHYLLGILQGHNSVTAAAAPHQEQPGGDSSCCDDSNSGVNEDTDLSGVSEMHSTERAADLLRLEEEHVRSKTVEGCARNDGSTTNDKQDGTNSTVREANEGRGVSSGGDEEQHHAPTHPARGPAAQTRSLDEASGKDALVTASKALERQTWEENSKSNDDNRDPHHHGNNVPCEPHEIKCCDSTGSIPATAQIPAHHGAHDDSKDDRSKNHPTCCDDTTSDRASSPHYPHAGVGAAGSPVLRADARHDEIHTPEESLLAPAHVERDAIADDANDNSSNHNNDASKENDSNDVENNAKMPASRWSFCSLAPRGSLIVCMVGLPGRGKSFIGTRLSRYMNWNGVPCELFNAGRYRRQLLGADATAGADFFNPDNMRAKQLREKMAELACEGLIDFLSRHRVAVGILDATNTTRKRRQWVKSYFAEKARQAQLSYRLLFIESFCTDEAIVTENILRSKCENDDFKSVKATGHVLDEFRRRIKQYERVYEPLSVDEQLSFIKIINVKHHVVMHKVARGLSGRIAFFLMNLHPVAYPIYLALAGESIGDAQGVLGGDERLTERGEAYSRALRQFVQDRYVPHMILLHATNNSVMNTLRPILMEEDTNANPAATAIVNANEIIINEDVCAIHKDGVGDNCSRSNKASVANVVTSASSFHHPACHASSSRLSQRGHFTAPEIVHLASTTKAVVVNRAATRPRRLGDTHTSHSGQSSPRENCLVKDYTCSNFNQCSDKSDVHENAATGVDAAHILATNDLYKLTPYCTVDEHGRRRRCHTGKHTHHSSRSESRLHDSTDEADSKKSSGSSSSSKACSDGSHKSSDSPQSSTTSHCSSDEDEVADEVLCPVAGLDSINFGRFSGQSADWIRAHYPRLSSLLHMITANAGGKRRGWNSDRKEDDGNDHDNDGHRENASVTHDSQACERPVSLDIQDVPTYFQHIPASADVRLAYSVQFPSGESCRQVSARLEPALMAIMRTQSPVFVVCTAIPAQGILAFLADIKPELSPTLRLPQHCVVELGVKNDVTVHPLLPGAMPPGLVGVSKSPNLDPAEAERTLFFPSGRQT